MACQKGRPTNFRPTNDGHTWLLLPIRRPGIPVATRNPKRASRENYRDYLLRSSPERETSFWRR